ncbi:CLUMA_CG007110, isoform A [Clunio marinus]|uniref:CLUMA_CG007110, isoform A n=1 Tax=Clunio marinus TaxID=568069 RepID=A0A1J1I5C4_9DIPT|nr:CLUMA_CG007110, isoform A [Clunio marinus]
MEILAQVHLCRSAQVALLESIKDFINGAVAEVLPFFEGADIADFIGTNQEKSDNASGILFILKVVLSNNGIPFSAEDFLPLIDDIIFNTQSTGEQKKIDEITASVDAASEILYSVLESILGQIATETNFSPIYLLNVARQRVDLADYPISCIAEALIQLYQFMINTYRSIENAAIAAKASLEAMP